VRLVRESLRIDEKDVMIEVNILDLSRTLTSYSVAYIVWGLLVMLSWIEYTRDSVLPLKSRSDAY
jgi:hypothetical protein